MGGPKSMFQWTQKSLIDRLAFTPGSMEHVLRHEGPPWELGLMVRQTEETARFNRWHNNLTGEVLPPITHLPIMSRLLRMCPFPLASTYIEALIHHQTLTDFVSTLASDHNFILKTVLNFTDGEPITAIFNQLNTLPHKKCISTETRDLLKFHEQFVHNFRHLKKLDSERTIATNRWVFTPRLECFTIPDVEMVSTEDQIKYDQMLAETKAFCQTGGVRLTIVGLSLRRQFWPAYPVRKYLRYSSHHPPLSETLPFFQWQDHPFEKTYAVRTCRFSPQDDQKALIYIDSQAEPVPNLDDETPIMAQERQHERELPLRLNFYSEKKGAVQYNPTSDMKPEAEPLPKLGNRGFRRVWPPAIHPGSRSISLYDNSSEDEGAKPPSSENPEPFDPSTAEPVVLEEPILENPRKKRNMELGYSLVTDA